MTRLEALSVGASPSWPGLRWPEFLLVEGENTFLWGEGREVFRVESGGDAALAARQGFPDLTRDLDRLVSAARTPRGTLAVLDARGRVAVLRAASVRTWTVDQSHLQNRPGELTLTENRIYLLLQGDAEDEVAIVAYTLSGVEAGRWGRMPANGMIQSRLRGGGIAACPDGAVFFSYINSPQIFQLRKDGRKSVEPFGEPLDSFREVSEREIHSAYQESRESRSAVPLVKLGLQASRVMSVRCSQEGLLLRQVARPAGQGAQVEVWDLSSRTLLGTVPTTHGSLLDAEGGTLYIGALREGLFNLERIRFGLRRPQPPARGAR